MSLLRRLLKMLRGSRGSLGDSSPAKETYSVLIMDMFHYHDPEHEYTVGGFPTRELAVEYARRVVRKSVEYFGQPNQTLEELREGWFHFGEDAVVIGGNWAGLKELDFFIDNPATPEEVDWQAISKQRFTD